MQRLRLQEVVAHLVVRVALEEEGPRVGPEEAVVDPQGERVVVVVVDLQTHLWDRPQLNYRTPTLEGCLTYAVQTPLKFMR